MGNKKRERETACTFRADSEIFIKTAFLHLITKDYYCQIISNWMSFYANSHRFES